MKAARRSDMLVTPFQRRRRNIPEDGTVTAYRVSNVSQQFYILTKMQVRRSIFCVGLPQQNTPPQLVVISAGNYD
jgi:hypothetical protein